MPYITLQFTELSSVGLPCTEKFVDFLESFLTQSEEPPSASQGDVVLKRIDCGASIRVKSDQSGEAESGK